MAGKARRQASADRHRFGIVENERIPSAHGILEGTEAAVFSDVRPNPEEADVEEAYRAFRESGCDAVIAFGGGSALDVGKAVRLRIKRPGADRSRNLNTRRTGAVSRR